MDHQIKRTRAQESRAAIQRLYIAMRHLFIRGTYKPLGVSGEAMIDAMKDLRPEIYGNVNDPERVELDGLLYVMQRLPKGIEECRHIRLISREGLEKTGFTAIIPAKRRRDCYRIDEEQMFIEMTRGRSDIYDILTHLTFLYIEAEKIRRNSLDSKGRKQRDWLKLEQIIELESKRKKFNKEVAYTYLSTLLGRTYEETVAACERFSEAEDVNSIFHITYWLGRLSMEEALEENDRQISFSSALREKVGHHIYGEKWANRIKAFLFEKELLNRPIHIISATMHSVMNSIFGLGALKGKIKYDDLESLAKNLSIQNKKTLRDKVQAFALKNGMYQLEDTSGMNISVQIFDTEQIDSKNLPPEIEWNKTKNQEKKPVIVVMDYAFGEQAYETMDELLKPYEPEENVEIPIHIESVSVMGKAGILQGDKGDIMIPNAHVFEGTADNYPFENALNIEKFKGKGLGVYDGPMITVLGTSLQNKDILRYFLKSSWEAAGLEMEGAHYQKAIQAASKIRSSISPNITLRYAYYASDNPLETGSTLASGSLGEDGVKPTYMITIEILNGILG
ncbi:MAG: hypothetical protein P1U70_08170 [Saprospiraceae bacterium]|nr:hypothetical protein [Saprospiraceae bacterium]